VRFVTGVTKSREEAESEKQGSPTLARQSSNIAVPNSPEDQLAAVDNTRPRPASTSISSLTEAHHQRNKTDKVMEKAERAAAKTVKHGANEDNVPDRQLGTVRSPPTEANDPGSAYTLPVVEEAAENASNSGRSADASPVPQRSTPSASGRSRASSDVSATAARAADFAGSSSLATTTGVGSEDSVPPPTPPKDSFLASNAGFVDDDDQLQAYRTSVGKDFRPPTPPKDDRYLPHGVPVANRDKDLPPTPTPETRKRRSGGVQV
jgi:1-phosphatidylinositol-4-phosphate 5-kinase